MEGNSTTAKSNHRHKRIKTCWQEELKFKVFPRSPHWGKPFPCSSVNTQNVFTTASIYTAWYLYTVMTSFSSTVNEHERKKNKIFWLCIYQHLGSFKYYLNNNYLSAEPSIRLADCASLLLKVTINLDISLQSALYWQQNKIIIII